MGYAKMTARALQKVHFLVRPSASSFDVNGVSHMQQFAFLYRNVCSVSVGAGNVELLLSKRLKTAL